jgi:predicted enzyme related to lactoylglutathione lyase
MTISAILAQATVADLESAAAWYTTLFGRGPDANPMPGLLEWHLADTFGIQVWAEPERAGRSSILFADSDLDARAAQLADAGVSHEGPYDATSSRVLQAEDPDGNRIVFTSPLG